MSKPDWIDTDGLDGVLPPDEARRQGGPGGPRPPRPTASQTAEAPTLPAPNLSSLPPASARPARSSLPAKRTLRRPNGKLVGLSLAVAALIAALAAWPTEQGPGAPDATADAQGLSPATSAPVAVDPPSEDVAPSPESPLLPAAATIEPLDGPPDDDAMEHPVETARVAPDHDGAHARQAPEGVAARRARFPAWFGFNQFWPKALRRPALARLVGELDGCDRVRVEGHTCNLGSDAANDELGRKRAERVRELLIREGVAADKLLVVSRGAQAPVADNQTPRGRSRNRRVEILCEMTSKTKEIK